MTGAVIFGVVAGVVIAMAGTSFIERPLKAVALIAVLVITYAYTRTP